MAKNKQEKIENHCVYLIDKARLRTRVLFSIQSEELVETIKDIHMQITVLINSPGGPDRVGNYLQNDFKIAQDNGDTVIAFAYPQAKSSAARLLVCADESYVTDDTQLLFHSAYILESQYNGDLNFPNKTTYLDQTVYVAPLEVQIFELRKQLKLSKTVDSRKFDPYIIRAIEMNREYPEISLSGKEAEEIGLVTKSFSTLEELHKKLSEKLPETMINHPEVEGFLS